MGPCWKLLPLCNPIYARWLSRCDCALGQGHDGLCICGHELEARGLESLKWFHSREKDKV